MSFFLPLFSDFGANGEWKVGAGAVSTISLSFLRHEILAPSGVMRGRPPVRRGRRGRIMRSSEENISSLTFSLVGSILYVTLRSSHATHRVTHVLYVPVLE